MRKGQISSHIHYCCCGDCRSAGRLKASTLSLSVLVAIEMFNAFNALSEDNSLLQLPPWSNPWLLVATCISLGLHCVILYIPFLAQVCYLGDLVWGFGVHGQLAMGIAWKYLQAQGMAVGGGSKGKEMGLGGFGAMMGLNI